MVWHRRDLVVALYFASYGVPYDIIRRLLWRRCGTNHRLCRIEEQVSEIRHMMRLSSKASVGEYLASIHLDSKEFVKSIRFSEYEDRDLWGQVSFYLTHWPHGQLMVRWQPSSRLSRSTMKDLQYHATNDIFSAYMFSNLH